MLANIDKTAMTAQQREYPMREGLEELVQEVAKTNPLLNFSCNEHCVTKEWERDKDNGSGGKGAYESYTYKVYVFQDGEQLGSLLISTRYRRSVGSELVYGVESFRIHKERGRDDTAFTKDLKVAIRTAKKTLIARQDTELYTHIYNEVGNLLRSFAHSTYNGVRYAVDVSTESMVYAQAAYEAHKAGKTTVELPVRLKSVSNYEEYLQRCEQHEIVSKLQNNFQQSEGYPTKILDDGKVLCIDLTNSTLLKFNSFSDMPTELANKLAMFKVLNEQEPYAHLGVQLSKDFFFLVK